MSNSLDPDQAIQNVGPDLGPNCLQRVAADDTSRQRVYSQKLIRHSILALCIIIIVVVICYEKPTLCTFCIKHKIFLNYEIYL